jgi:hypothetical protein
MAVEVKGRGSRMDVDGERTPSLQRLGESLRPPSFAYTDPREALL